MCKNFLECHFEFFKGGFHCLRSNKEIGDFDILLIIFQKDRIQKTQKGSFLMRTNFRRNLIRLTLRVEESSIMVLLMEEIDLLENLFLKKKWK
jgi:hypothetical protein